MFYREKAALAAANPNNQQRAVRLVQPFAVFCAERCYYYLLTIKRCIDLAVCNLNLLLILRLEFDFEIALGWFGNCACSGVDSPT